MNKNNLILTFFGFLLAAGISLTSEAQTKKAQPSAGKPAATQDQKKIKLDFESEMVMGDYEVPDAQFINSRRIVKFRELFNRRKNFIQEVEANKGLFNEYQK